MPLTTTAHRVLAGAVAGLVLLAMAAAGVVWHAPGAVATGTARVAQESVVAESSTTTSSSSTTSTSSTSTTSTTKPRPVTTTAPVRTTVVRTAPVTPPPTAAPATTPPPVTQPRSATASAEERCAAALKWVAQHGLALPAGWGFRCPGQALENGTPRWGVACWNCEGNGSWIAVDIGRIGSSEKTLYYVVAHEICHAIDYENTGNSTELGADLCAALHGAPRPL